MKKYQPQSLAQLKTLVKDESVYLGDIDTSLIADMTSLFEPDGMFDDCNCAIPSWYNKMKG
ncbi:hypothetical protein [Campylobacter sp.]|uniref:hypothetical protein n=1 Tax=Campylobacter sp. TaxID=205 RepID=UPI002AA74E70|nr:hypothetical protein [Campylobacter sp.]MCI7446476.1 hypothetical protein [Campylobacter sp.]